KDFIETSIMQNTIHKACEELAALLVAHGTKHAVLSPGSRNAPLIIALARENRIKKTVIVDERSASFVALGLAQQTGEPVALICTSGSALLNFAPAVAEAYYAHLPLIVISADRPEAWIDQNDSQTMRQPLALQQIVKHHCSLPSMPHNQEEMWWINRSLNEAIIAAKTQPCAPAHINIYTSKPLYQLTEASSTPRVIETTPATPSINAQDALALRQEVHSSDKVLIVCGFMRPSEKLNRAIAQLAQCPNIAVISEHLANVHAPGIVTQPDVALAAASNQMKETLSPNIIIYTGGALVSQSLKQFLRQYAGNAQQWRVGIDRNIIDTMQHLTRSIAVTPLTLFSTLCPQPQQHSTNNYGALWQDLQNQAWHKAEQLIEQAPWCAMKAIRTVLNTASSPCCLQLSNGLTVRYAMALPQLAHADYWCNRGVSGIDGSTSTALGAMIAQQESRPTLLITGDMSLAYDINGLTSAYNSHMLKIVVICNDGGSIFRFIDGPHELPEFEQYFQVKRTLPIEKYAHAFGYTYFSASSMPQLQQQLPLFFGAQTPALLALHTNNATDAQEFSQLFSRLACCENHHI
ncbi:MAG: 2-succinyl-5-enolpyruvyl-6-hydroxy-3-cyclohexene-1-carboxylic-acid synthase, partial [Muribaculaceae bacterium]